MELRVKDSSFGDFSGGPMVKLHASSAGDSGSTLGKGTKIPHASRLKIQYIKLKQCCNKFNKDFKSDPHPKEKNLKKKKKGILVLESDYLHQ